MDIWVIGQGVLLLVLVTAVWRRAQLAGRFQIVSMTVCALLTATCLIQAAVDGLRPWTLGLGALAITFFAVELVRQVRHGRREGG